MAKLYACVDDDVVISSSTQKVIRFVPSTQLKIGLDINLRILIVEYEKGVTKWSQIPNCEVINDKIITTEGEVPLLPANTVNGLTFYLKTQNHGTQTSYLFSSFINYTTEKSEWQDTEVGGYMMIPLEYQSLANDEFLDCINQSSFYHVRGTFTPANILGVDMKEKSVISEWTNDVPYGDYPRLYLNEAEIIAAFIKTMKEEYPEIEFFPQSSERKNLGKETVFYQSRLLADRSFRFNSNVLFETEKGRWYQTTIPLVLHYQTSDVAQFSHRRSKYLLSHFFMDVHHFYVKKKRWYKDRFGNDEEVFRFSTYWDREIADDLVKQDAPDGSGRDTFVMTIQCDLICSVVERSEEPIPIQDVINNIYFGNYSVEIMDYAGTKHYGE